MVVGHWHGDTFDLPLGIEPALSSEVCANQAFVFDGRVVGLQFHLEWTEAALRDLIAECADELAVWDPFVMTAETDPPGRVLQHPGVPGAAVRAARRARSDRGW